MAITLYPPKIESKLPSFTGTTLHIPFQLNRAHARHEFNGMSIILKTVTTGAIKYQYIANDGAIQYDNNTKNYYVEYDLREVMELPADDSRYFMPMVGQYYKLQLAFTKNGEVGYYSSTAVIKYTSNPVDFKINGLKRGQTNIHQYTYTGVYSQEDRDITEKVYSYRFDLKNSDGTIFATSGDCLHNSSLDTDTFKSTDSWTVEKTLDRNTQYFLSYSVTTLNNHIFTTEEYVIMAGETVDITVPLQLKAEMNNDEGYSIISLMADKNYDAKAISGNFVLLRSSSEDNFSSWNEICYFELAQQYVEGLKIWEDFTIQHGLKYIYAIQAYNNKGLFTNPLYNTIEEIKYISANKNEYIYTPTQLLADFEDAFLFDGKRQLKIRFNPKVSSFKNTILESKTDTIGGKYPFIFRNGNVKYKEFPISGLISLISDPNEKFMKGVQNIHKNTTHRNLLQEEEFQDSDTQLTSYNIRRERQFKLEVLEWLTNGEPKLFRSPGEGNYIVRLMNTSLTPNDKLGRMLHTFNCTAYEIAEPTFANLNKYGFIQSTAIEARVMKIAQLQLGELTDGDYNDGVKVIGNTVYLPNAYMASITYATPGVVVGWNFGDGNGSIPIAIGSTGSYYIEIDEKPVVAVSIEEGAWDSAKLTFGYYDVLIPDTFSYISNIILSDEIAQFFGEGTQPQHNIIFKLEDIRKETGKFHYIRVKLRDHVKLYYVNGIYSRNEIGNDPLPPENWSIGTIYYIENQNKYYNGHIEREMDAPSYVFKLNENKYIDFSKSGDFDPITSARYEALTAIDEVNSLYAGTGLIIDLVYQLRTIEYTVEETDAEVITAKNNWIAATISNNELQTEESASAEKIAYNKYINTLTKALEAQKEAYEIVYAV